MTGPGIGDRSRFKNALTLDQLHAIDPIAAATLREDVLDGADLDTDEDALWLLFSVDGRTLEISDFEVDSYTYDPNKRRWNLYGEHPKSSKKWEKKYPILEEDGKPVDQMEEWQRTEG